MGDCRAAGKPNPEFYTLFALSRAGIASQKGTLAQTDWFKYGAERLLKAQQPDGSFQEQWNRIVDTSFALLFLKNAASPDSDPEEKAQE